ncbi:hypothetical protein HY989_02180 [Candidatus Micrarchaeota archaeon]|nr:hypothetical protein [Candidatus Micrarchaeota archaeon]
MKKEYLIFLVAAVLAFNLGYNAFPSSKKISFSAPAVLDSGKGSLVEFQMSLRVGSGLTLVNIKNAAFKEDSENALRKARNLAESYLGTTSSNLDIVLEIMGNGNEVSGESAGGMFALAIIALQTGRKLKTDVAISAAISESAELEEVGGIEEKILAAKENSRKVFLVSKNQPIKEEQSVGSGISIIRVKNLKEAAGYMIE